MGLCSSSANSRFGIISLLTADLSRVVKVSNFGKILEPEGFLSKNYKPLQ